jgi:maltooligosyltrehalose trehalohydrolase
MTGRREAYFSDHAGAPQEFISAAKYGFLFQGQRYAWQKHARGTRADGVPPAAFVTFLENHDQLANSGDGSRVWTHTSAGNYRAMTALFLLSPGTPMLFQGQEFGASTPFLYFADHKPELAAAVQKGRAGFVSQFPSLASEEAQARLAPPHEPETFERCKLKWEEWDTHAAQRALHADLLELRRTDAAFRRQEPGAVDGAIVGPDAFVLRFAAPEAADERVLVINLGNKLEVGSLAEPLVAPPDGYTWSTRWSSEHPDYAGLGVQQIVSDEGWQIPGHSAAVLAPMETRDADR